MFPRHLSPTLTRTSPFCLFGARGVGKTTVIRDFAGKFSNSIHLDLETASDRSIFNFEAPAMETLKAISFLKGIELRGKGTLIILDELARCPGAVRWATAIMEEELNRKNKERQGTAVHAASAIPLVVATSSSMTEELSRLADPADGLMQPLSLFPFSFGEFLAVMEDPAAMEAFDEVPVPYYAYEKLLNYFHLYTLIGGMPEIMSEYGLNRHLTGLRRLYEKIEERIVGDLEGITAGSKSRDLAMELLQNTYPFAATRISLNRFGNMEKGSREIGQAFHSLERAFFLQLVHPGTSATLPLIPDRSRFPRLQMLDTGLVNYFSGIQKPLFRSHDMNAIFEGQIARQVVGQELLSAGMAGRPQTAAEAGPEKNPSGAVYLASPALGFWTRAKTQSTAEVDFVIPFNDLLIPVVVRSGEPGRLRALHQNVDIAPHAYAVRLYAGKLAVQQTHTLRGKKFFLLNLPYFLAGKINDHLKGFIRLANG